MNVLFLDKQHKSAKGIMLLTMVPLFAAQFCFELIFVMYNPMKEYFADDNFDYYYTVIYTVYFLSNSILPYFTGVVRDMLGDRHVIIHLSVASIIGQAIVTFGFHQKSYLIIGIGRIILGWGVESVLFVLTSFISSYYKYDYFTFIVGIYQMFNMFSTVFCFYFAPRFDILAANEIGIILSVLAIIPGIIGVYLDYRNEQDCLLNNPVYFPILEEQPKEQKAGDQPESKIIKMDPEDHEEAPLIPSQRIVSEVVVQSHWTLKLSKNQPKIYWNMVIFYVFVSTSILSLINVAVEYLNQKWLADIKNGEAVAQNMVELLWLFSGIATPLFGIVIDYYGHRSSMTILSGFMCLWAHCLVLMYQPFEGLLMLGFSFTLSFTTVWSGLIYILQHNQYGKSFAVIICLQNFGLAVTPLIIKFLRNFTHTVIFAEFFLLMLAIGGAISSILIYYEDHQKGKMMDRGIHVDKESDLSSAFIEQKKNINKHQSDIQHLQ